MLPSDTMLRAMIDEREHEIQREVRRSRLLRFHGRGQPRRDAQRRRSGIGAVLGSHLVRDLRHALANARR